MPVDTTQFPFQHPVLVWEKEGGYIEISYSPESVYNLAKKNNLYMSESVTLVITQDMETNLPKQESTKFTRESLGIIK